MTDSDSVTSLASARQVRPSPELQAAHQRIAELEANEGAAFRLALDLREAHGQLALMEVAALNHDKQENEVRYLRNRLTRSEADLQSASDALMAAHDRILELESPTTVEPVAIPDPGPTSTLRLMRRKLAVSKRDDLQKISGLGPALEQLLNSNGIYTYAQLAELDRDGVLELQTLLPDLRGRVAKDKWVNQAKRLMPDGHSE